MRRSRSRALFAAVCGLAGLTASGCYPPSQTPTEQPVPPGGRVVATGPVMTEMRIWDTTADLSTIVYSQHDFLYEPYTLPYRFWVYDDDTGTTTRIPVGRAEYGTASLSPDGRWVVFSSNDPNLQVGPTAANCHYEVSAIGPTTPTMCDELYLYDLETDETRQLTGLEGSSEMDNTLPDFTEDGQAIEFVTRDLRTPRGTHRLDLATGEIEDASPTPPPTSWDRDTHVVDWDPATGTLTSEDTTSGSVTTLWEDEAVFHLASAAGNGRYIVLSNWVTERSQIFRLIDTDTGSVRIVHSEWVAEDGSRYAFVQLNVLPDATDRLVIAPLAG